MALTNLAVHEFLGQGTAKSQRHTKMSWYKNNRQQIHILQR